MKRKLGLLLGMAAILVFGVVSYAVDCKCSKDGYYYCAKCNLAVDDYPNCQAETEQAYGADVECGGPEAGPCDTHAATTTCYVLTI